MTALPPPEELIELLQSDHTADEIAKMYGVTVRAVHQRLKRASVNISSVPHKNMRGTGNPRYKLPDNETLLALRKQGLTVQEIADIYHCSNQAVSALLRRLNTHPSREQ